MEVIAARRVAVFPTSQSVAFWLLAQCRSTCRASGSAEISAGVRVLVVSLHGLVMAPGSNSTKTCAFFHVWLSTSSFCCAGFRRLRTRLSKRDFSG